MPGDPEDDARAIFRAALEAVDPGRLVRRHLLVEEDALRFGGRRFPLGASSRLVLVGAGKAAVGMAEAAETMLGARITRGVVLAVEGTQRPLRALRCTPCPHPLPDARSVAGTRQLLGEVSGLSIEDLVLALWSGGGSACLGLPVEGITPGEMAETTRLLLTNHFQIQQVNQVRRVCLAAGDGGVARAAFPARILALVLCDAPLADVASGPTMSGAFSLDATITGLRTWGVWPKLPEGVRRRLGSLEGRDPRKAIDPSLRERVYHGVVGGPDTALQAALQKAVALGYASAEAEQPLQWEARLAGDILAKRLRAMASERRGPQALVAAGETSVALKGSGRGGRNQELALGAALSLAGLHGVALLAGGTDGVDGSSDAAGAVVTGRTCAAGSDADGARKALAENDSHAFFLDRPERLVTGPTGTNVADLAVGLVAG
jgi:glycerate-2-kinase